MKRYDPRAPRLLLGLAAAAMTAATLAISVLAPAGMEVDIKDVGVLAHADDSRAATSQAVVTAIDVVADRGTHFVPVVHSRAPARRRLQG